MRARAAVLRGVLAMRVSVLLGLSLSVVACTRSPTEAKPEAPKLEDCTLETPLVPGVPGSPGHLIPSDINPNGASELATLMRTMVADLEASRAAVEQGRAPAPMWSRHRKLRCAWPTAASDRNPAFDGMAMAYLAMVQALDAKPKDLKAAHNAVIDACRACHENTCAGPIEKIVQLRLPDGSDAGAAPPAQ
jgi:hypothetical protein